MAGNFHKQQETAEIGVLGKMTYTYLWRKICRP
jgi:hypothetical protein